MPTKQQPREPLIIEVDADFPADILIAHSPRVTKMEPELDGEGNPTGEEIEVVVKQRKANARCKFGSDENEAVGWCKILQELSPAQIQAIVAALRPVIEACATDAGLVDV